MKESIDKIAQHLDGNIIELAKRAKDEFGSFEYQELSVNEAYPLVKLLTDQLKASVDKGYLDRISISRRNNIYTHLASLKEALDIFEQYDFGDNYQTRQYQAQYIQAIYALKDAVDDARLIEMSKSFGNYYTSIERVSVIEGEYKNILSKIAGAEDLYNESYEKLSILNEKIDSANELLESIDKIAVASVKNEKKIDGLVDSAKEYVQDIEDRRSKVEAFHKNVDTMDRAVQKLKDENEKNINNTKLGLDNISEISEKRINEAIRKTNEIVTENSSLQAEITTLLHGATAGTLYTEFKTESNKIRYELWFWLGGIVLVNISLLCFSFVIIFGSNALGISALNLSSLTAATLVKIFLTIPIILLDWFIIRQYNIRRELMEKYTFKSLVSISLVHYNELVKSHVDNEEATKFIVGAIDRIYSSPFELPDNKTAAAISALTDKGTGIIEKAVEKAMDKIKT